MTPSEFKELQKGLNYSSIALSEKLHRRPETISRYRNGSMVIPELVANELKRLGESKCTQKT